MPPEHASTADVGPSDAVEPALTELVDALAALPRAPGSPGEAAAAELFARALRDAGARVEIEPAAFLPGYADHLSGLCALALGAGLLGSGGRRRRIAAGLAGLSALAIADDVSNLARVVRRLRGPRPTQNVVATLGEPDAARTLVVLAHHDAAPTGVVFGDEGVVWASRHLPGLLERIDTGLPLWWAVLGGPVLVAIGALTRHRSALRLGTLWSGVDLAAFLDIATSPTVPGANDNASALAVQLGLARRLGGEPVPGLRILLVSCGAEEVIQGGIHAFARRHFPDLDPRSTWMLNLDTVGSPELILLEGEGPLVMEDYHHRPFRDLIARVAAEAGAPVRRGLRARNSTDAVIPSRASYPTATLCSINRHKALSNYHQMSDTAENIDWRTVAHALLLCERVARELGANPWLS